MSQFAIPFNSISYLQNKHQYYLNNFPEFNASLISLFLMAELHIKNMKMFDKTCKYIQNFRYLYKN